MSKFKNRKLNIYWPLFKMQVVLWPCTNPILKNNSELVQRTFRQYVLHMGTLPSPGCQEIIEAKGHFYTKYC